MKDERTGVRGRGRWALGLLALSVVLTAGAALTLGASTPEGRSAMGSVDPLVRAKAAFTDRDLAQAEKTLREYLEVSKNDVAAKLLLGRVLLERGRLVAGRDIFNQVLKLDPRNLGAHWGMAATLRAMGQVDQALIYYQKAAQHPDGKTSPSLWKEMALAQKEKGDLLGAMASARESLALDSEQMDLSHLISELAAGRSALSGPGQDGRNLAFDPLNPRPIDPRAIVPQPKAPDPSQLFPKPGWKNR